MRRARSIASSEPVTDLDRLAGLDLDLLHVCREGRVTDLDRVGPRGEVQHPQRRTYPAALSVNQDFAPRRDGELDPPARAGCNGRLWLLPPLEFLFDAGGQLFRRRRFHFRDG